MTVMTAQPDALESRATTYLGSAQAILDAAEELSRLVFEQSSDAVDAVFARTGEVAQGLNSAHTRYSGTAGALKVFAVEVRGIQSRYQDAGDDIPGLTAMHHKAVAAQPQLRADLIVSHLNGSPAAVVQQLEDDLRRAQLSEHNSAAALSRANALVGAAEADFETAAKKAIAAIDSVIDAGKDSFWDKLHKFVEDVYETFVNIAKWVKEKVETAIRVLVDVLAQILTAAIIALIVAVAVAVAVLLMLATIAGGIASLLGVLLVGGFLIVSLVWMLGMTRVASDVLKPTPRVYETIPSAGVARGSTLSDAADEAGEVDRAGGDRPGEPDQTSVVKIEKVVDGYGNVSWRVILPSTQDWQMLTPFMSDEEKSVFAKILETGKYVNDDGSVSDVDGNLVLRLFPDLRGQYERAVYAAMEKAGIEGGPDGDPVMLIGFSQGGIMAGHMASHRADDYNIKAVLTFGAPIGDWDIPAKTKVVSIEHEGDPVPDLDLATNPETPTRHTIRVAPPAGVTEVGDIHSPESYGQTLRAHMDEIRQFAPEFDDFYTPDYLAEFADDPTYYQFSE